MSASGGQGHAGDVGPGLEGLDAVAAMIGVGEVGRAAEEIGDLIMDGEEALRLTGRLEAVHDPLSSSGGLVAVFGSVLQPLVLPVLETGHDRPLRRAVAPQLVGAAKGEQGKSFHLDTYCFDSNPERLLFWDLLRENRVKKVWFTGMLTHGQSDFLIQYIDPDTRAVRSYYPDFLFLRQEPDGTEKYVIVEVKADHQIEDRVVQAKKDYATRIAAASGMEYHVIKATDADQRRYRTLL